MNRQLLWAILAIIVLSVDWCTRLVGASVQISRHGRRQSSNIESRTAGVQNPMKNSRLFAPLPRERSSNGAGQSQDLHSAPYTGCVASGSGCICYGRCKVMVSNCPCRCRLDYTCKHNK